MSHASRDKFHRFVPPIHLGAQESPEEEEDGSLVILLALGVRHEGLDGIQEAKVKLLCLIEDEHGLLTEPHGLAYRPLQLSLRSSREGREEPSGSRCRQRSPGRG